MTPAAEKLRQQLREMREELGDREAVGKMIGRSVRSIASYEAKGQEIPLWYQIVIPELHRRKKSGRPLSPA